MVWGRVSAQCITGNRHTCEGTVNAERLWSNTCFHLDAFSGTFLIFQQDGEATSPCSVFSDLFPAGFNAAVLFHVTLSLSLCVK